MVKNKNIKGIFKAPFKFLASLIIIYALEVTLNNVPSFKHTLIWP